MRQLRTLLRQVHLVTGVGLSLLLLVLAVSGTALVFKETYWRAAYPALAVQAPPPGPADHAAAAHRAAARFGDAVRSIKLPTPGVAAYHLYLEEGEAFLSAADHTVIDAWRPTERPMALLFDLHAHLMAGEGGERVVGALGLLGALLTVTGLVLWWPARRRLSARTLLPGDLSRRALLVSHRDLGAVAAPVLLLLLLTGSGMVFYGPARALLNGLFGDPVPADPAPLTAGAVAGAVAGAGWDGREGRPAPLPALFDRAGRALPDARIVFYYPPREGTDVHGFRLRRPCELHPNGRSYVYMDGSGTVLRTVDACAAAPGERATHAIYPLHAGKAGSRLYTVVVFLGGVGLALVSAGGAAAYLRKLSGPRPGPGDRTGARGGARYRSPATRAAAPRPAARPVAHPQRKL